jgi:hypothetical protein
LYRSVVDFPNAYTNPPDKFKLIYNHPFGWIRVGNTRDPKNAVGILFIAPTIAKVEGLVEEMHQKLLTLRMIPSAALATRWGKN